MLSPNAVYTAQSLLLMLRDYYGRGHRNIVGATEVDDCNNRTEFSRHSMVAAHKNSQQVVTVTEHIKAMEAQDTPSPEIPACVGGC